MNPADPLRSSTATHIDFPFRVDATGRTATTDRATHARNLIEQVLFTAPGERVNRPNLGSGIEQAVFSPNSDLLAETTRVTAEAAIQQHLGHLIRLISLHLETNENTLTVEITYALRNEPQSRTAIIRRNL